MESVRTRLAAEAFGTFCLVFAGTGAIAVDGLTGGEVGHLGVALSFALVVMAMIYAIGEVSGAHINPAVTLGFYAARRFEGRLVLPYVASQLAGAVAASFALRALLPGAPPLGVTLPAGSVWQAFLFEVLLTWILMLVILRVSLGARETGIMAGAAVAAVIGFAALFAGPVTGASMNPARSFAPAVASGQWESLWLYLTAPLAGALLAVPTCICMQGSGCCGSVLEEAV